jgi:hypothetical protein
MKQMPIHVIHKYLKGKMEVDAFTASLDALSSETNPLRYSFFSLGIRELVNHVIDRLAPNSSVVLCGWWDDNDGKRTTPKRTEKMQYAIRAGLSDEFVTDVLKLDLSFIIDRAQRAVDELSIYVHYDESTFNLDHVIGNKLVEDTLSAVQRFFEDIEELKRMVSEALEVSLHEAISSATIEDVLGEVDILSTHYLVEGSDIEEIIVSSIDYQHIDVQVRGNVDIEHQYGSDGDYERGDGVRIESSYPYVVNLQLDVNEPLEITIETDDIIVNTDSFYANEEDEDLDHRSVDEMEETIGDGEREDFDPTEHF